TLVRQLEIKLKKDKDIDEVLAFQAEPLLPFPIENAIIDKIPIDHTQDGTIITILAARKDHLKQHLEQLLPLEIEPEVVGTVPSTLASFSKFVFPNKNPHFVLHLGLSQTCCIFIKNEKLIAAQSGVNTLLTLKKALGSEKNIEDHTLLNRA